MAIVAPKGRKHLSADALLRLIRSGFDTLPDYRSLDVEISLTDALMSAFAMFSLQSPSLLAFDKQRAEGNLQTIYGMTGVPCDTRMREILDPLPPALLRPLFKSVFRQLQRGKALEPMAFLEDYYLARIIHQPKKSTREGTFGAKMSLRTTASQDHHGPKTNASDGPGTIQSGLIVAIGRNASGQPPGADIPCFALEPTGLSIELTGLARSAAHRLIRSNCV